MTEPSIFGFTRDHLVHVKAAYDKLEGGYPMTPERVKEVFDWFTLLEAIKAKQVAPSGYTGIFKRRADGT